MVKHCFLAASLAAMAFASSAFAQAPSMGPGPYPVSGGAGLGANTYTGKQTLPASTTAAAPLNIPQGTAPTSPNNGDLWATSGGVYAEIAGAPVGPFGTGGGSGVPANLTLTNPSSAATFTLLGGKTFTVNNTVTLAGTDGTTITLPGTSAIIARTDAGQTFGGSQVFSGAVQVTATACAYQVTNGCVMGGTKPSVTPNAGAGTGTIAVAAVGTNNFSFVVGPSPTSGPFTVAFTAAAHDGWTCSPLSDQTTQTIIAWQISGGSTTSAVFQAYLKTGATTSLVAGDTISGVCGPN